MTGSVRVSALAITVIILAPLRAVPAHGAPDRSSDSADVAARAKQSFQRGVQLYEERNFDGAGVEFRRAYDLLPSFRILFNQGRVAVELRDYASAIELFTRYLTEGGDHVPAERRRELEQEIERLQPRVGQIEVVAEETGAEVYLDEILVGRTPMPRLRVNVGRHRLELRPKQGLPQLQFVDCPGQETVVVRFARPAEQLVPSHQLESGETSQVRRASPSPGSGRSSARPPWLGWAATGLCAVGAAVFGVMAYRSSQDLQELRDSYPVSSETLDSKRSSTRLLGGIADGLLAGAVAFGSLSLYFSFDHPSLGPGTTAAASTSHVGGINISGHF